MSDVSRFGVFLPSYIWEGDGPERARLQARAGTTVRFLGSVDRSSLIDLFARCHAYLVPGATYPSITAWA